jgi:hypothetical protein
MNIYKDDLTDTIGKRGCGIQIVGGIKKPFKIEDFCAQFAWMGKDCPVYPWIHEDSPCEYMVGEGYADYICPIGNAEEIVEIIAKEGTPEQKTSAEKLVDSYLRYGSLEEEFHEKFDIWGFNLKIKLLWRAEKMYKTLGIGAKVIETHNAIREECNRKGWGHPNLKL